MKFETSVSFIVMIIGLSEYCQNSITLKGILDEGIGKSLNVLKIKVLEYCACTIEEIQMMNIHVSIDFMVKRRFFSTCK